MIRVIFPAPLLFALFGGAVAAQVPEPIPARTQADVVGVLIEAEFALQAGQLGEAAARYLDAARLSGDAALAERAFRVALAAEDRDVMRQALARWQQLAPEQPQVLAQSVALALLDGEHEAAMEAARRLLALPGEPAGWALLLRSLSEAEGDARIIARAVLAELPAESAMPARIEPWLAFAGLARHLGDKKTAGRLVDSALVLFPDDASARLLQAARLRERGDVVGATQAIARLAELPEPLPAALRRSIAREMAALGDPVGAARWLGRAGSHEEDLALRVGWLVAADDVNALAELKQELLAARAEAVPLRALWLGHVCEALAQWRAAEHWYRAVEGREQERARTRLAFVLARQAKLQDAVTVLRALQLDEEAEGEWARGAFIAEADLHGEAGDDAAVLDAYARALSVFEGDPLLLYRRALYHDGHGRTGQALADLQAVLDEDAENAAVLNAYGYLLGERTRRYSEALPYVERALRLAPESPAILDSVGWIKHRLGAHEQALPLLQRAWAAQRDAEIAVHLGEVLWQLQRRDEARALWREALAIEPEHPAVKTVLERLQP